MSEEEPLPPLTTAQRRRRVGLGALIIGVCTAAAGVFLCALVVAFGAAASPQDGSARAATAIFAGYTLLGLGMAFGGWRLCEQDPRGYYPTLVTTLGAFVFTTFHVIRWLLVRQRLDYALLGLTVPLLAYATLALALHSSGRGTDDGSHRTMNSPGPPYDESA